MGSADRAHVVTKEHICRALRELGLGRGGTAIVHSSLSSMGFVEGGADTVIDAFLEVIEPGGTLIMPAFSFLWDKATETMKVPPFDVERTPSQMGAITETFRRRAGTLRSTSSSHSWCAGGRLARKVLCSEDGGESIDWETVFDNHGWIVLLGVHHNRSNLMHHVEHLCADVLPHVPLMYAGDPYPGTKADHGVFNRIDKYLLESGVERLGKIGAADVRVASAGMLVDACVKIIREVDRAVLLCDDPECEFCVWARGKYERDEWQAP